MPVLLVDSVSPSSDRTSTTNINNSNTNNDDEAARLEEGYAYGSVSGYGSVNVGVSFQKPLSHYQTMSTRSITETAGEFDEDCNSCNEDDDDDDDEEQENNNESEIYHKSTSFQRAMPERFFALCITLLLEIPVLMMVSGGSDALCSLIGRSRYQLLVGFLPLTSAISGNVGLQASTLTTRAISHSHVTIKDYWIWLSQEIMAAIYLGLGMGASLGSIAFGASGFDWTFGLTIAIAQLLSIVTAGITGTIAPLLFSFLFKRDSGKWGGPLETAVQDIVGSFAMVIVSYHILKLLGPGPIDPTDVCGAVV